MFQFFVAGFVMAVGLAIAGAGTHLYQGMLKEQAILRFDGKTYFHMLGHLAKRSGAASLTLLHHA